MRRRRRAELLLALPVWAVLGLAGCTPTGEVTSAAGRFADAVHRHDGREACALLADRARRSVEVTQSCAEVLPALHVQVGPPGEATVWGDRAQVRATPDTLFLARYTGGWRVTGAGCRPRGADLPYECEIGGP
jgi:hypothetical protein